MPTINHQNPPPFSIANYSLLITNYSLAKPFTFSAKEKDSETGLSVTSLREVSSLRLGNLRTSSHCTRSLRRFGSRYYSSDLCIWLSVDPMASKYPSFSPYTYCADNPIKLVDPNGEDIWTINENGTINRKKNTIIDRIDVVDGGGNITEGTEAKYGTIKQHTLKMGKTTIDYFEIKGDELAKETFENIANNTSIEWAHASIGLEKSGSNIVGTSHEKSSCNVLGFLFATNYTLKEIAHNHPSGSPLPSYSDSKSEVSDIEAALTFQGKFPKIKQSIYINSSKLGYENGYYEYDKLGPKWGVVTSIILPKNRTAS